LPVLSIDFPISSSVCLPDVSRQGHDGPIRDAASMTSSTLTAPSASPALALPTGSILSALGTFRWRLAFVAVFCAVVATEVLAQRETAPRQRRPIEEFAFLGGWKG